MLRARNCAVAQDAKGLCTPGTTFAPQTNGVVVGVDFIKHRCVKLGAPAFVHLVTSGRTSFAGFLQAIHMK